MSDLLPPLPLLDGALLIDNSSIKACPRFMEYSWLRRRLSAGDRPALNFGAGLHVGLAAHYHGLPYAAPMIKYFEENPQPATEYRSLDYALTTMEAYCKRWPVEDFKIVPNTNGEPCIEASFMHKLGSVHSLDIYFTGRIDLIVENQEGVWILDHKTSSQFGKSFDDEMFVSAQMRGYCWSYQQAFGRKPMGYIVNGIRTRPPTKEEALLSAYGAKAKGREDNFARLPWHVTQDEIDEWQEDTLNRVSTLLFQYDRGRFERHKEQCVTKYGKCQFYNVCTLPRQQRMTELYGESFMENVWSPLNKPENNQQKES